MKNLSNEHRANGETHGIINIADTITPLLLVAFRAEQSFPQAFVSIAKRFREERRQGSHGLPNQIVIQYSVERKEIEEKSDTSFDRIDDFANIHDSEIAHFVSKSKHCFLINFAFDISSTKIIDKFICNNLNIS